MRRVSGCENYCLVNLPVIVGKRIIFGVLLKTQVPHKTHVYSVWRIFNLVQGIEEIFVTNQLPG